MLGKEIPQLAVFGDDMGHLRSGGSMNDAAGPRFEGKRGRQQAGDQPRLASANS
jgi:hypothetical protein